MTSRVALVTGGTGGIGTAIVKRLASLGHKVATNYRDEAKTKAWAAQLKAQGVNVVTRARRRRRSGFGRSDGQGGRTATRARSIS